MIITGATGFLGGQLLRQLRKEYRIIALGRRDPQTVGAPVGPGIEWFRVDIADRERLQAVFAKISELGGAHILLHMAAYYDFTGEDNPEYRRTNVEGTANLLELARPLQLRRFIYTSSLAACPFPAPGDVVDETTPPEAPVPYARSKWAAEALIRQYTDIPTCIVRPGAVFSEWCEYEPLDNFLRTWCSRKPTSRILTGSGQAAIPFLHVMDLLSFFLRVVEKCDELAQAEILLASSEVATTHLELFNQATGACFGSPREPLYISPGLAAAGIRIKEMWGRITGRMPFERSWMVDYIDRQLRVDTSHTRRLLDWAPNPSLDVLSTLNAMVHNLVTDRRAWHRLNYRRGSRHNVTSAVSK